MGKSFSYTDRTYKVLQFAKEETSRIRVIGREAFLIGLIREKSSVAAWVLTGHFLLDLQKVRQETEEVKKELICSKTVYSSIIQVDLPEADLENKEAWEITECAREQMCLLGHQTVGPEHILLGLIRGNNSIACQVLKNLGIDFPKMREEILHLIVQPHEYFIPINEALYPQQFIAELRELIEKHVPLMPSMEMVPIRLLQ